MLARFRLLKGATALLYLGPLFAGLSGFGWGMVSPFVAIFVVWLMILRPEQWPASNAEWLTLDALGAALTQVLSQLLLVVILFAIGRGVGGIAGFVTIVNPWLPLAISFFAIPICRLIWDARLAAERGEFLDGEAEAAQAPLVAAEATKAVAPLLALQDDAAGDALRTGLASVLEGAATTYRLEALDHALNRSTRSHTALRRGLVIWATEPEIVAPGQVPDAVLIAFRATGHNPDLLRLFLPRALALAAAFPDRSSGFPTPAALREAAKSELDGGPNSDIPADLRADLKEGLLALANTIEAVIAPRSSSDTPRHDASAQGSPSAV